MESNERKITSYRDIVFEFIQSKKLFTPDDRILIAVSGGRDSMTLLDILHARMEHIAVAHVNYQLRDHESDRDEEFVQMHCRTHDIPFFVKEVEQEEWNEVSNNVQAAARTIRYRFFEDLLDEHDYRYVATAHHLTDALETMLFQSMRGCGLKGVRGIPLKRDRIVRPLLCLSREQINTYIDQLDLSFREDRTNVSEKYMRNRIRQYIIPRIREVFPDWENGYLQTHTHLSEAVSIYEHSIAELKERAVEQEGKEWILDKPFIINCIAPVTLLWEVLKDFDFQPDQCRQMLESPQAGRRFSSESFEILEERNSWILREKSQEPQKEEIIEAPAPAVQTEWGRFEFEQGIEISIDSHTIAVDRAKIDFPLTLRSRRSGDRFQPIGMKGQSKTVKKFMIDEKVPLSNKEFIPILVNEDGTIIWVCGYRMDERFKVTEETEDILRIHWDPST